MSNCTKVKIIIFFHNVKKALYYAIFYTCMHNKNALYNVNIFNVKNIEKCKKDSMFIKNQYNSEKSAKNRLLTGEWVLYYLSVQ